jgi:hypothetical protein
MGKKSKKYCFAPTTFQLNPQEQETLWTLMPMMGAGHALPKTHRQRLLTTPHTQKQRKEKLSLSALDQ